MSPSGRYSSSAYQDRQSSSNSGSYRPPREQSSRYNTGPFRNRIRVPSAYAGDPSPRYNTGPFSYRNARCTSSYQRFSCRHTSGVVTQRAPGCPACGAVSPNLCTPRPTEVFIPTFCLQCQPSHSDRRNETGDPTRPTRRDPVRDTLREWERRVNPNEFGSQYRGHSRRY